MHRDVVSMLRNALDARVCVMAFAVAFSAVFVAWGGLPTSVEAAEVIPFMLMGGMCSEDLMARMIMSGTHLSLAVAGWLGVLAIDWRRSRWNRRLDAVWDERMSHLSFQRVAPGHRVKRHPRATIRQAYSQP